MTREEFRFKRNCLKWLETQYPQVIAAISRGEAPKYPVHVEIHPHHFSTPMCNNNCPACTGKIYRCGARACEFGIDSKRLIQTITGFGGKVNDVIFSGNSIEPLLYPEIVPAIKAVRQAGAMFSLYSNFYYANRPGVIDALTTPATAYDYVRISLNAGKRESYNFSHRPDDPNAFGIVLENVRELTRLKKEKKADLYVHLTYLLDKYNSGFEELEGIVRWAASDSGINGIRFSVYQKPMGLSVPGAIDFSSEDFNSLKARVIRLEKHYGREDFSIEHPWEMTQHEEKEKKFLECRVGKVFPVIGMDGGVYPCTAMASPFSSEAFRYGNINHEDFWAIWDIMSNLRGVPLSSCHDCTRGEYDINTQLDRPLK